MATITMNNKCVSIKKQWELKGLDELIEANNGMIKLASHYNEICYYYWPVCNKNLTVNVEREKNFSQ